MARRPTKTIEVNLHGLREYEAWAKLNEVLENAPNDVKILKVIHGYHGGQVLKQLVRVNYVHYRIDYVQPLFGNDGETWYYLKPDLDKNN